MDACDNGADGGYDSDGDGWMIAMMPAMIVLIIAMMPAMMALMEDIIAMAMAVMIAMMPAMMALMEDIIAMAMMVLVRWNVVCSTRNAPEVWI